MHVVSALMFYGWVASMPSPVSQAGPTPPQPIISGPWMSDDDYPAEALKNQEQGTVQFALTVSDAGKITACRITESSGSPSLDAATCALVTRNMRFKPARDASGKRTDGELKSRLNWRLPKAKAG